MEIRERHALPEISDALTASRAVAIVGPRQSGKTTLARQLVAAGELSAYVTLDDERVRDDARADGIAFVASLPHGTVIDEVQRVPELLLELKRVIDLGDQRPGQFLLTGSGDLRRMRSVPDALPGRVEYVDVLPLTRGELLGRPDRFVDDLFAGQLAELRDHPIDRASTAALLVAGGYPGAAGRTDRRRAAFFASYLDGLVGGDALPDVSDLRQPGRVIELLRAIAPRSSQLVNVAEAANTLAASERSIRTWLDLLVSMYLVHALPAWHANLDQRRIKRPKAVIADSGVLCHLLGVNARRLATDTTLLGQVFETFIASELRRQAVWAQRPYTLHHFRDRDGREVDIVAERPDGRIVGIEVKATATPRTAHLSGLRHLRSLAGDRWAGGALVTLTRDTRAWEGNIWTVPLDALWTSAAAPAGR